MAGNRQVDVVVIGAGAAGLMCAATAGYQGHRVLLLDHANKPGKKILMSGGGRCNFTNLNTTPEHFVSANPHFCKSALKRYSPWHFVDLVERHGVEHVEKAPGQLFCADSAKDVLRVLLTECEWAGAQVQLNTSIRRVSYKDPGFELVTSEGTVACRKLVVATGGLSIPTMGATGFGYQLADQFGLKVYPTRAGLVPFTLQPSDKDWLAALSGISTEVVAQAGGARFAEPLLITHRGLSGPAMLQVSSFWQPGQSVHVDWLPAVADPRAALIDERQQHPNRSLERWLRQYFSQRLAAALVAQFGWQGNLQQFSNDRLGDVAATLKGWQFKPSGTEGYRTAEVTLGGVDTDAISSRDFQVKEVPGLHFIGEVLDVTGQLGGFNFQWAWASGWCTGMAL
ncbi:hypothetical protein A11A3_04730 [Alcanivorax hongdengensis A-11-3]|uniref:Flavoprotein n=1 Tax=Alcanivorax hongdengensis A-11-3 TaxID=1177179 RepID=L0WDY3_9GAMM|nr:NAD(P)/FAD-dependent oxidoreductase [Alcanivorax hongdengensis]EKF75256.1 hypothetical protein A11A3_04730 [Alcanivorax hongdengensis A-11-3]